MQQDDESIKQCNNNQNEERANEDSESVDLILLRLSNVEYLLENAALTAALMNFQYTKLPDYNFILFYYVIRKYEKLNETMNAVKNYCYIHLEIFTIFIHPKSILHVPIGDSDLLKDLAESVHVKTYITTFAKTGKYLIEVYIKPLLENFKDHITLGLESFSFDMKIHKDLDRNSELDILEKVHETILSTLYRMQKVRCIHQNSEKKNASIFQDFQITAILLSLNTQYEYFVKSKKYSYLNRSSQKSKSDKTLLSLSNISSFKKTKIKSHILVDFLPSEVVACAICENILWGYNPQGIMCKVCQQSIHRECKQFLKPCDTNGGLEVVKMLKKIGVDKKPIKVNDEIYNEEVQKTNIQAFNLDQPFKKTSVTEKIYAEPNIHSNYIQELQHRLFSSNSNSQISQNTKKTNIKSTKSLNVIDYVKNDSDIIRSKSARNHSPESKMYDVPRINPVNLQVFQSCGETSSSINPEQTPSDKWDSDEEMNVPETFDPEIELKSFPYHKKKSFMRNRGEYSRLLVLMEFHHKTKFIRMILKRFKYILVDQWLKMGDHLDLYESLSLGCIEKLYVLIKSLVEAMDECQQTDSYDTNIAKNVYFWLTTEDDKNYRRWLQLSVDLCCTNILHSIRNTWNEQKKLYPKLNEILSVEINRTPVIEQVANMKPLLFNLPLIVAKIVKDLNRYSQFREEAEIWEKIHQKLKNLPKFIDERCMPVVELINNGTVANSTLKFTKSNKEGENGDKFVKYITHFPKTIFQDDFIDFQLVMISNLRESQKQDAKPMQPSVYTREEIEAAAICYENKMIILQKENDKYLLKKFKSINQKKLFPMITFDQVHVTKQTLKEVKNYSFELTILLLDQAILIQILFKENTSRDTWFDHISNKTKRLDKVLPLKFPVSPPSDLKEPKKDYLEESKDDCLSVSKSVLNNIKEISIILDKTKEQIEKLDDNKTLHEMTDSGPNSTNEYLLTYLKILSKFVVLGAEMIESSNKVDESVLLNSSIVSSYSNKFKDLSMQMNLLTEYKEKSIEPKLENSKRFYGSIEEYIEEIIAQAKEKMNLETTPNRDI